MTRGYDETIRCRFGHRNVDHTGARHDRCELVFAPAFGARRTRGQHEIAHVGGGVVHTHGGALAPNPDVVLVRVTCNCGADRKIEPEALLQLVGWSMTLKELAPRMRCSKCGKKAAEVVAVARPSPRGIAKNSH